VIKTKVLATVPGDVGGELAKRKYSPAKNNIRKKGTSKSRSFLKECI